MTRWRSAAVHPRQKKSRWIQRLSLRKPSLCKQDGDAYVNKWWRRYLAIKPVVVVDNRRSHKYNNNLWSRDYKNNLPSGLAFEFSPPQQHRSTTIYIKAIDRRKYINLKKHSNVTYSIESLLLPHSAWPFFFEIPALTARAEIRAMVSVRIGRWCSFEDIITKYANTLHSLFP